jgi:uncharacterized protein YfaT (DUF1175 family)
VSAVVVCVGVLAVAPACISHSSTITTSIAATQIEADGVSTALLQVRGTKSQLSSLRVTSSDPSCLRIESVETDGGVANVLLRAGVLPGNARLHIRAGKAVRDVDLQLAPSTSDTYGDGTPDFLRLNSPADSVAFRQWMAFLAESLFFTQKNALQEVGDCAALIRFSYREALRHHDGQWASELGLPRLPAVAEIKQYSYPHTPMGAAIFRTRAGSFAASDLGDGTFGEFADANTLRRYNMHFVSRRVSDAQTGDVLFFRQESQRSPYHAMLYMERSSLDQTSEPLLVYHTGPIENHPGEIRRPTLHELLHYPDARWRPLPENSAFLGVYRWNILRGTD